MRILDWYRRTRTERDRRLERRIRKGAQTWGRQVPDVGAPGYVGNEVPASMKGHATIAAVVIRRDQAGNELSREDLGVISETEWDEGRDN
jgi:hypothetical protein